MSTITNITPLDGRYQNQIKELSQYFSEMALIKYRLMIEVEYFIALSLEKGVAELKPLAKAEQKKMRKLYEDFDEKDTEKIKEIEKVTNHDVKAVEYWLKEKLQTVILSEAKNPPALLSVNSRGSFASAQDDSSEFIHFGLTSEDINNLAYTLMLKDGLEKVIISTLNTIFVHLKSLALTNKSTPLLSLTHGQPATPTTLGKELAVFANRLKRYINHLKILKLDGKFSGAVGNFAALYIAYPKVDWIKFSQKFISSFGLIPNLLTTQIEPHDSIAHIFSVLANINNIIRDLDQDMWYYISRGIFVLKNKAGEIGSSTMPHKVNPINFENSEGNLGMANAILRFMADKLPVSRMQRDLTDSTVIRNQGTALAYYLLAYKNTVSGLERVAVDKKACSNELDNHWEVLAEAIQTVLRKVGYKKPYEKLKELTRGERITKEIIKNFIDGLDIPKNEKDKLLKLTPATYLGLSTKLIDLI